MRPMACSAASGHRGSMAAPASRAGGLTLGQCRRGGRVAVGELGTARKKAAAVAAAAAEKGGGAAAAAVEKLRYADEEDYVKAGGRLLGYVRMQEGKPMDGQSSISDKVGPHTLPFLLLLLLLLLMGSLQRGAHSLYVTVGPFCCLPSLHGRPTARHFIHRGSDKVEHWMHEMKSYFLLTARHPLKS